jgi:hypothetical protein
MSASDTSQRALLVRAILTSNARREASLFGASSSRLGILAQYTLESEGSGVKPTSCVQQVFSLFPLLLYLMQLP